MLAVELYLGFPVHGTPKVATETGTLPVSPHVMSRARFHLLLRRKQLELATGRTLQVPERMNHKAAGEVGQSVVDRTTRHEDIRHNEVKT